MSVSKSEKVVDVAVRVPAELRDFVYNQFAVHVGCTVVGLTVAVCLLHQEGVSLEKILGTTSDERRMLMARAREIQTSFGPGPGRKSLHVVLGASAYGSLRTLCRDGLEREVFVHALFEWVNRLVGQIGLDAAEEQLELWLCRARKVDHTRRRR